MTRKTVLITDDEPSHRLMVSLHLKEAGYQVIEADNGQEAIERMTDSKIDLILMDVRMPVMDGQTALSKIKKSWPDTLVIMMTAYGSIEDAVMALKTGAWDYLTKPIDADELVIKVTQALKVQDLARRNETNQIRLNEKFGFQGMIGNSPSMIRLVDELRMIASSQATVLILGASGVGKEVVANVIHHNSPRSLKPFIKVNCAALPETLLEAELFGSVKGAYTGAVRDRAGRFMSAQGGTLFLDEIGTMPLTTQTKLLRVLQEGEIEPLGSDHTLKVDVRILAATNTDLKKDVEEGLFREDLYYRLNVVSVTIPPLRERASDIPILAEHFMNMANAKNNRFVKAISEKALDVLVNYDWPGNVRQLANVIERAVVLCPGETINIEQLPPETRGIEKPSSWFAPGVTLKEGERALIEWTLISNKGNRTHSADQLGVTRKTLQNKIKEYGLEKIGLENHEQ